MPFGKYAGRRLVDLPEPYVVWLSRKGFPEGELGEMLRAVYEIKVNGLEYLFLPLQDGDLVLPREHVMERLRSRACHPSE